MGTLLVLMAILGLCMAGVFPRPDVDGNLVSHSGFRTSDVKKSGFPVKWSKLESIPLGQHLDEGNVSNPEGKQFEPRFEDPQHLKKIEDETFQENEIMLDEFNEFENSSEIQNLEASKNGGIEKLNVSKNVKEINVKVQKSSETNISIPEDESLVPTVDSNISADFTIFNLTNNLIDIQFMTENISSINSMSLDETDLMSEGGEIALFQDTSTTGFEFLIDSETTKNLLLAELLAYQDTLENGGGDTTDLDESEPDDRYTSFDLKDLESELNPTVSGDNKIKSVSVTETFNKTENLNILTERDSEMEVITNSGESTIGSTSDVPIRRLECPRPGFCLFSFLRRDACSQNNDCHGTSICCKSGCSMACVDA